MIPTRIGQLVGSCTFAGLNWVDNHIYAILVPPRETERFLQFSNSLRIAASQTSNGYKTTNRNRSNKHTAIRHCKQLTVDNCSDFYLPSVDELWLCYYTLVSNTPTQEYHWETKFPTPTLLCVSGNKTNTIVTRFSVDNKYQLHGLYWSSTVKHTNGICGGKYEVASVVGMNNYGEMYDAGYHCVRYVRPVRRLQIV